MLTALRTLSLILLLLLVSFPASADTGLASLSVAFGRLVILLVWSFGSLALLAFALSEYTKKKTAVPALLTYLSFVSLAILYAIIFYFFMEDSGSLIFDTAIYTMDRDNAIADYHMLIGAGCVLLASVIAFGVYHWKSARQKRSDV